MRRSAGLLLFAFLLSCSVSGFAWGCSAHQVVALIAEAQLDANARKMVAQLLTPSAMDAALHRFCGTTTLGAMADASTWADDFRSQHRETGPWHYWDIPLAWKTAAPNQFCEEGCVTRAIRDQLAVLRDPAAPRPQRAMALMFVIHFIADLHQPLHVNDNNDMGGNCVPVAFFGEQPKGDPNHPERESYRPNLHSVWDTGLPEKIGNIRREHRDGDVAAFARSLEKEYARSMRRWKRGPVDPVAWALEVHRYNASNVYGRLPARIAAERPAPVTECSQDNHVGQRMLALQENLGEAYLRANRRLVQEELAKAGARLAATLNSLWP